MIHGIKTHKPSALGDIHICFQRITIILVIIEIVIITIIITIIPITISFMLIK